MNTVEFIKELQKADKANKWLFTTADFKSMFPADTAESLKKALARQISNGLIERVSQGLYANPAAQSKPTAKLESLVAYLREDEFNMLTGETVLSRWHVISQMMFDYLVVMTTGSSRKFETAYGTIEFIHTKQNVKALQDNNKVVFDETLNLHVATVEQAYKDLKSLNRNLDLVDMEELQETIGEQN